jgi:hypothetical protein
MAEVFRIDVFGDFSQWRQRLRLVPKHDSGPSFPRGRSTSGLDHRTARRNSANSPELQASIATAIRRFAGGIRRVTELNGLTVGAHRVRRPWLPRQVNSLATGKSPDAFDAHFDSAAFIKGAKPAGVVPLQRFIFGPGPRSPRGAENRNEGGQ